MLVYYLLANQNSTSNTFSHLHYWQRAYVADLEEKKKWITKQDDREAISIKIMNPESTEKTTPRLVVTKTARAALIRRINMTQNFARVRKFLLTPTRILTL